MKQEELKKRLRELVSKTSPQVFEVSEDSSLKTTAIVWGEKLRLELRYDGSTRGKLLFLCQEDVELPHWREIFFVSNDVLCSFKTKSEFIPEFEDSQLTNAKALSETVTKRILEDNDWLVEDPSLAMSDIVEALNF